MEGFYAAYMTGRTGQSVLLFAIKDGRLTGVDVGGMRYDGHVDPKPDGSGFSCRVSYTIRPGASLITRAGPVATPTDVSVTFDLPTNFGDGPIIGIQTPTGPLNAKFVKLRDF